VTGDSPGIKQSFMNLAAGTCILYSPYLSVFLFH